MADLKIVREAERAAAAIVLLGTVEKLLEQLSVEAGGSSIQRFTERVQRLVTAEQQRQLTRYDTTRAKLA